LTRYLLTTLLPNVVELITHLQGWWADNVHGRPHSDHVSNIFESLIKASKSGRLTGISPRCLLRISNVLSWSKSSEGNVVPFEDLDLYGLLANDFKSSFVVHGCESSRSRGSNALWTSIANSYSSHLPSGAQFCALIDAPSTPSGLGSLSLTIPTNAGVGPYIFCDRKNAVSRKIQSNTSVYPSGWYSGTQTVMEGATKIVAHLTGHALLITFPRSDHNTKIMERSVEHAFGIEEKDFLAVVKRVKDMKCYFLHKPIAFLLQPFEYHVIITLRTTIHIGAVVWPRKSVETICVTIDEKLSMWEEDLGDDGSLELRREVKERLRRTLAGAKGIMGEEKDWLARRLEFLCKRVDSL
jgi:hypothetical protein